MKIGIVLGTRPEIIKLSSMIRYCEENNIDYFVIHTNQHYSSNMDEIFFTDLKLPSPNYNLHVGSGSHGYQTSEMLKKIEPIFMSEKPDVVIIQGDTNSTFAGALAASKMNISVGHIEAGLRSYDNSMPEEKNRKMIDHISDFLFCPTEEQYNILKSENLESENLMIVGNTVCDAVLWAKDHPTSIVRDLNLQEKEYILLTLHRPENVDSKERITRLIREINALQNEGKKVIFPIHPRTKKKIEEFALTLPSFVQTIEPIGFLDMITLQKNAQVIITDSGGMQEEACMLQTPCITLRDNTERPETVSVGANKLFSGDLLEDYSEHKTKSNWENPFGQGNTAEEIIKFLLRQEQKS